MNKIADLAARKVVEMLKSERLLAEDRTLSAKEAAEVLRCSVKTNLTKAQIAATSTCHNSLISAAAHGLATRLRHMSNSSVIRLKGLTEAREGAYG